MASVLHGAPQNQVNSPGSDCNYSFEQIDSVAARTPPALEMQQSRVLPDPAMERAREDLAEREYLNLIRWAVRKAPDLLRVLRIAYLFGQDTSSSEAAANLHVNQVRRRRSGLFHGSRRSSAPNVPLPSEKLEDVEREHIRRILTESATVLEAASKLGIDNSTLWRKRKRYKL
jgi:Bacterial regulatory protein, Fis family